LIGLPLSDEAWQRVSNILSRDLRPRFGRPVRDSRDVLNAIVWVTTPDEKWQNLPSNYPPPKTCYIKWLQWRRSGLMSKILAELGV
jgi:transposase